MALNVKLKSRREIDLMRNAGRIVYAVLKRLEEIAAPGVTTAELDAEAERLCHAMGGQCLFKGVPGQGGPFPGNLCCSINEQVVHGIPGKRVIREGDLVSVDFGARLHGYCGDGATTLMIGKVDPRGRHLVEVTKRTLDIAIEMARPGERWSNIAREMQKYDEGEGFSVVRQFVGHGIGTEMHEDPKLQNYVSPELLRHDILLETGMTLAVEPMVNMGTHRVKLLPDGWTVVTADRQPSAHFEHTIAVVEGGADVLTMNGTGPVGSGSGEAQPCRRTP